MFANGISIQNIIAMLSILFSSGAIGYLVRLVVKIEVLQTLFDEKQAEIAKLQTEHHEMDLRVTTVEGASDRMEIRLSNVDRNTSDIPKVLEKLNAIEKGIDKFVPEKEIKLMVSGLEQRIKTNETDIHLIKAGDKLRDRPKPEF